MEMNNEMMMQMMQMMMQNQAMMNQMMIQMFQNGQMGQLPVQPSTPTIQSPTINVVDQGEIQDLKAQIAQLKEQLEYTKLELAAERQTHEATKHALQYAREANNESLKEFSDLKKIVRKAETYLGQKISDIADNVEELGGDDYYEENKKEWNDEGLTNQEKHERVKAYKDMFKDEEEDNNGMRSFE